MGETVEFASNGDTATGYLALPPRGHGPGVVVIQEWWGIVHHITDVCDRFAAAGFVALAPDLYHGTTTTEPDEAGKLIMSLQIDGAGRDMVGAGRWLAASERTAGDRVGIVGFCAGGALALYAATLSDVFAATVAYYPGRGSSIAHTRTSRRSAGALSSSTGPSSTTRMTARARHGSRSSCGQPGSMCRATGTPAPSMRSSTTTVPRSTTRNIRSCPGSGLCRSSGSTWRPRRRPCSARAAASRLTA